MTVLYKDGFDLMGRPKWRTPGVLPVAVGVSGGLDSTAAYHLACAIHGASNVFALYIDFGQPYRDKELAALAALAIPHATITVPLLELLGRTVTTTDEIIPGRNLIIATILAPFGEEVWLAGTLDDMHGHTLDKTQGIFDALSATLTQGLGRPVTVKSPWAALRKVDMLRWAQMSGAVQFDLTVSCYDPVNRRCGNCHPCVQRHLNMTGAGIGDRPSNYVTDPRTSDAAKRLFAKYASALELQDFSHYHRWRIELHWRERRRSLHQVPGLIDSEWKSIESVLAAHLAS